jgi:hypothetical protein
MISAGTPSSTSLHRARSPISGELVIFANPSLRHIDWSTPASAARSMLWSDFKNGRAEKKKNPNISTASMGHTVVHFKCRDVYGRSHDVWTGMTGQNNEEETRYDLFKAKIGLGAVLKNYVDGSIDSDDKSRRLVASYRGRVQRDARGRNIRILPKFIRFAVTEEQCTKAFDFYQTFKSVGWDRETPHEVLVRKPKSQILQFGFLMDPYQTYLQRKKNKNTPLGGGCSSFGVSFLKVIGRFDPFFEKQWTRQLIISERLVGGPWAKSDPGRRVSVQTLLIGPRANAWYHRKWGYYAVNFYDIEKIWNFIDGARNCSEFLLGSLPQNRLPSNCSPEIFAWVRQKGPAILANFQFEALSYDPIEERGQDRKWEAYPVLVTRDGIDLR